MDCQLFWCSLDEEVGTWKVAVVDADIFHTAALWLCPSITAA
jgi:hypothetical protein